MRIQERGWSVIGSPLSVQLGCMEDLYGVCFRSESIYIVLSSVYWLFLLFFGFVGCAGCFCCFLDVLDVAT